MYKTVLIAAVFASAVALPFTAQAGPYTFSDTGQTTCYDGTGNLISCASGTDPGQDGDHPRNPMSFTDNGDGTVTDNNTGLMWQQADDGNTYNWYQASGTYDATYNPSSVNVCGSLTLAGYSDWRLPTKKELLSIVDYSVTKGSAPALDATAFPNGRPNAYWTSTIGMDHPNYAWDVVFHDGEAGSKAMNQPVIYDWFPYVRCVRGSSN